MISNDFLKKVDTREKLGHLFAALDILGVEEKIAFTERITEHKIGHSGVRTQDLSEAIKFFLAHEWQAVAVDGPHD